MSIKQVFELLLVVGTSVTNHRTSRQSSMHWDMQSALIAELAYIAAQLAFQILKNDTEEPRFALNPKQNGIRTRK